MSCGTVKVGLQQIKEGKSYCLEKKDGKMPLGEATRILYDEHPLTFKGIPVMKNNRPVHEVKQVDFSRRYIAHKGDGGTFYTYPDHTRGGRRTRKSLRKSRRKTSRR